MPELIGDHIGRAWTGHAIEDACPCPQEPCGLVDRARAHTDCEHHPIKRLKSMRQGHPANQCPGQSITAEALSAPAPTPIPGTLPAGELDDHALGTALGRLNGTTPPDPARLGELIRRAIASIGCVIAPAPDAVDARIYRQRGRLRGAARKLLAEVATRPDGQSADPAAEGRPRPNVADHVLIDRREKRLYIDGFEFPCLVADPGPEHAVATHRDLSRITVTFYAKEVEQTL